MISDMSSGFKMVKNWGLKKYLCITILKVLTTDSYLAKEYMHGEVG